MLRRFTVAVLIALAATVALSAVASTQEGTTSSEITDERVETNAPLFQDEGAPVHDPRLLQQARVARELLMDHHARLERQRQRVEQNSLEHHTRTSRLLGPRAPTETVPPMATIPPPPD
jgi:hypothetical protein